MKTSLKSALVLIAIAVVAVLALILAKQFFPAYVPKLDLNKIKQLQEVAPSGVSDSAAIEENYYKIITGETYDLDKFNSENGDANTKVLAIYYQDKGTNAGAYITETQCYGYSSQIMILLTAYDSTGTIIGLTALKTDGDYLLDNPAQYQKLKEAVIGKKIMSSSQITASTGATASFSASGIEKNLKLSSDLVTLLIAGGVK